MEVAPAACNRPSCNTSTTCKCFSPQANTQAVGWEQSTRLPRLPPPPPSVRRDPPPRHVQRTRHVDVQASGKRERKKTRRGEGAAAASLESRGQNPTVGALRSNRPSGSFSIGKSKEFRAGLIGKQRPMDLVPETPGGPGRGSPGNTVVMVGRVGRGHTVVKERSRGYVGVGVRPDKHKCKRRCRHQTNPTKQADYKNTIGRTVAFCRQAMQQCQVHPPQCVTTSIHKERILSPLQCRPTKKRVSKSHQFDHRSIETEL